MRIDAQIEPLVREALTAVVKSDPDRLRRAFEAFPDSHDIYGRRPTLAEVRSVADKLVEMEDWTDVSSEEVTAFLTAAYDGSRADQVLPADRIAPLAYVTAGNLLSSCCKEGEFWFNYLDRAESGLEASADD
jgi:hypothetical protein